MFCVVDVVAKVKCEIEGFVRKMLVRVVEPLRVVRTGVDGMNGS